MILIGVCTVFIVSKNEEEIVLGRFVETFGVSLKRLSGVGIFNSLVLALIYLCVAKTM